MAAAALYANRPNCAYYHTSQAAIKISYKYIFRFSTRGDGLYVLRMSAAGGHDKSEMTSRADGAPRGAAACGELAHPRFNRIRRVGNFLFSGGVEIIT